jgi:hypothetical protein
MPRTRGDSTAELKIRRIFLGSLSLNRQENPSR